LTDTPAATWTSTLVSPVLPLPTSTILPTLVPPRASTACIVRATRNANIRNLPGTSNEVVGAAYTNSEFPVIGRVDGNSWWEIEYSGGSGWISSVVVNTEGDCANIPLRSVAITDASSTPRVVATSVVTSECTPPQDLVRIGNYTNYTNWSDGIYTTRNVNDFTVALGVIDGGTTGLTFTIWISPCAVAQHKFVPGVRFWRLGPNGERGYWPATDCIAVPIGTAVRITILPKSEDRWGLGNDDQGIDPTCDSTRGYAS